MEVGIVNRVKLELFQVDHRLYLYPYQLDNTSRVYQLNRACNRIITAICRAFVNVGLNGGRRWARRCQPEYIRGLLMEQCWVMFTVECRWSIN